MLAKHLTAICFTAVLIAPLTAYGQEADAMAVEWQGKKLCEKLHEDDQIRILRCTFPPGAKHLRHQHPASFGYWLSGGKVEAQNASGTRLVETVTDVATLNHAIPWHEVTNVGDTTLRYLAIEMKYKQ